MAKPLGLATDASLRPFVAPRAVHAGLAPRIEQGPYHRVDRCRTSTHGRAIFLEPVHSGQTLAPGSGALIPRLILRLRGLQAQPCFVDTLYPVAARSIRLWVSTRR